MNLVYFFFQVDLFSKWLLLIPIHLEIHWSLVTVTMATKTISYYDSQGIVFRHTTDVSASILLMSSGSHLVWSLICPNRNISYNSLKKINKINPE